MIANERVKKIKEFWKHDRVPALTDMRVRVSNINSIC
jgi:hypothetical protein